MAARIKKKFDVPFLSRKKVELCDSISFSLSLSLSQGQNVENMFEIDEKSGEIKVKVPLDRDPPNGRPIWSFNVLATDNGGKNGLDGYAEVQVPVQKGFIPGRT